jgi:hypothetical protein
VIPVGPTSDARAYRRRTARARELTVYAGVLALLIWTAVAADVVSPGPYGRYSKFVKGNDFVQFYVAGSLAAQGRFGDLVDATAFAAAQRPLMSASGAVFPPVYGPHVALFFTPFSLLPYVWAYASWALLSLAMTGWAVAIFRRRVRSLTPWPWAAVAITAGYPPLGYLVLSGQISALALTSLALLVIALDRRSRLLSGVALGLLGYKVSLFVPAAAVCLLGGEALVAAAAVAVAVAELVAVVPIVGLSAVERFVENTIAFTRTPELLAKNLYLMASLRTFWEPLVPKPVAIAAYGVTGAAAVAMAAWVWRRCADPVIRVGALGIATVLAAPHLYFYDLMLLVPAFVASAGILERRRASALRWCTYMAFLAPFAAPLAALARLQPITIVFAAWLVAFAHAAVRGDTVRPTVPH